MKGGSFPEFCNLSMLLENTKLNSTFFYETVQKGTGSPDSIFSFISTTVKVHITPLTKFRPETPYGVKTLHAKYFQNRNCGFPITWIFVFGNDYQFRLIMMSTKGLILRRYMAENSKNVNTSQTSIFMIFPEKVANQHREAV